MLYGDNGSGKTTILNIVFQLLSPVGHLEHRAVLAKTPFERVSLGLSNGVSISASRPEGNLVGRYVLTMHTSEEVLQTVSLDVDDDGSLLSRGSADLIERIDQWSHSIKQLVAQPYYLTENREFLGAEFGEMPIVANQYVEDGDDVTFYLKHGVPRSQLLQRDRNGLSRTGRQEYELQRAVTRAERWLTHQALRGTSTGSENTNAVYLSVLTRLATVSDQEATDLDAIGDNTTRRLERLEERAAAFAEFGLGTPISAAEFLSVLAVPPKRRRLLEDVLGTYLDVLEARLDALEGVYRVLVAFTRTINSLMTGKYLTFNISEGMFIITDDGKMLQSIELSSGERQLLLLLCNVLVARDSSRLFIIDEPEISLNVKWQRQLLDVLLELTAGTDLQFLVATHSVEMVAGHLDSVAKLVAARA